MSVTAAPAGDPAHAPQRTARHARRSAGYQAGCARCRSYCGPVSPLRRCTRTACGRPAVATLTYVYADSTAVLGPLATYAEPHCYDLCAEHAERLTAPRGWEVVRLALGAGTPTPSVDDLEALAEAVREAARPAAGGTAPPPQGRRGHLRALPSLEG